MLALLLFGRSISDHDRRSARPHGIFLSDEKPVLPTWAHNRSEWPNKLLCVARRSGSLISASISATRAAISAAGLPATLRPKPMLARPSCWERARRPERPCLSRGGLRKDG